MATLPKPASVTMSIDEIISMFDDMLPSKEFVMRCEMEQMFPSIVAAMNRDVSEAQIVSALRKKWPGSHVATIIKLLNTERDRRIEHGDHIGCKPFGLPRKPKTRTVTVTGETCGSALMPQIEPDAADGDQQEVLKHCREQGEETDIEGVRHHRDEVSP